MFLHSLCGSYNISINYVHKRNQSFHPLKIVFSQLIFFFIQILQAATTLIQVTKAFHKNLLFQANSKHIFGRNSEIPQWSFLFSPKKRAFQLVQKIKHNYLEDSPHRTENSKLAMHTQTDSELVENKKNCLVRSFSIFTASVATLSCNVSAPCHQSRNATFQPPYMKSSSCSGHQIPTHSQLNSLLSSKLVRAYELILHSDCVSESSLKVLI